MDLDLEFVFVYVSTYTFIALFCVVILLRLNNDIGRQMEVRFFRLLMVALLTYCVNESVWAIGNFGYSSAINRFNIPLTILNATMVNSLCYLWFCYIESYLKSPIVDKRRLQIFVSIPHFAAVALLFTALGTDWVFYLGPNGGAERGPLYIVTIVIAYSYAAIATIRSVVGMVRETDRQRKRELLAMALFAIPPATVGAIDTIFPLMPIVAPAFFFSFLIVFTMLQETQISTDSLTELNNRRRADRHLGELVANSSLEEPSLFFLIDGNAFKAINDSHGHLEGDRALFTIAEALRSACLGTNAFIARWGGDEFVVMGSAVELGAPEAFTKQVEECLTTECAKGKLPYKLTVSIGWTLCTGGESAQKIIAAADKSLYEAKSKLPGRTPAA